MYMCVSILHEYEKAIAETKNEKENQIRVLKGQLDSSQEKVQSCGRHISLLEQQLETCHASIQVFLQNAIHQNVSKKKKKKKNKAASLTKHKNEYMYMCICVYMNIHLCKNVKTKQITNDQSLTQQHNMELKTLMYQIEKIQAQTELERSSCQAKLEKMNERIGRLKETTETCQQRFDCKIERAQKALQQYQQYSQSHKNERQMLVKEMDAHKTQLSRCTSQIQYLQNENETLKRQLLESKQVCQQFETEQQSRFQKVEQYKQKIVHMQADIDQLTQQMHQMQKDQINKMEENMKLRSGCGKLEAENELLRQENSSLRTENNNIRGVTRDMRKNMEEMHKKMSQALPAAKEKQYQTKILELTQTVAQLTKEKSQIQDISNKLHHQIQIQHPFRHDGSAFTTATNVNPPVISTASNTQELRKKNEEKWKALEQYVQQTETSSAHKTIANDSKIRSKTSLDNTDINITGVGITYKELSDSKHLHKTSSRDGYGLRSVNEGVLVTFIIYYLLVIFCCFVLFIKNKSAYESSKRAGSFFCEQCI
ncbi:hypothetical protein RFI_30642 [Reticulomyxa filosa]|uniref:Viral A-type inclusion protein n=1 Tax=Reticulomyxa filosa TaxID=46433 RepID=X6M025_RETFI|nr:hypothetical protein RFI_30642 [Reticulomyxa filosa]|eukprot:ETO06752.1 hypothetical protein RFI_30642 [Reticulomyxa filosa]